MVAPPHEPADERFTAAEFALYRKGYDMALVMALRVMKHAGARHKMVVDTKRLDAKRRRKSERGAK